jgi:serine/threonine protein kinase
MNSASSPADLVDDQTATVLSGPSAATPVNDLRSSEAPVPVVGEMVLDRYRVVAWAGLGTASVVFRAEHVEIRHAVAVKVVNRTNWSERAAVIGHLRNEAEVLAKVRHPHVPRVWDFSETSKYPCVVTDYLEGITLKGLIQRDGQVKQRRAVRLALCVADVFATLERYGIVHRDVKPDNIMLAPDGTAKLIDFGLAIFHGHENPGAHAGLRGQPRVGTVAYLAPEQSKNSKAVDHRADIYSLGATLFHALTGKLPFAGKNAAAVILKHMEQEVPSPRSLVPNLHPGLSELVVRMMAKDPNQRFAEVGDLLEALRGIRNDMGR